MLTGAPFPKLEQDILRCKGGMFVA